MSAAPQPWHSAALAGALGGLLLLGAALGRPFVVAGVVAVQAVLLADWHRAHGVRARWGGTAVAAATALSSDVAVLIASGERPLAGVPAVLALAVVAGLVHQLTRGDGRIGAVASVSTTVSGAVLASLGCFLLAVASGPEGGAVVGITALALAVTVAPSGLARALLGRRRWLVTVLPPVAALGVAVLGGWVAWLPITTTAALGLAAVAAAAVGSILAARLERPSGVVGAALPFALAGPSAYVLARLLVG